MEIRFESSECNGEELVKNFEKDFETSSLIEAEYSEFKEGVTGTVKEIHLNNAFVLCQDYKNTNTECYTLKVSHNHPVFLLQFSMEGGLSFFSNHSPDKKFILNKNAYNLFFIPASTYTYNYHSDKKHFLNIYFTESYLLSKMGFCFIRSLKKYQKAKKENNLSALFDDGLILNAKLRNIVNEFLNCSFDGMTRQSYLESKLTELVLTALMSTPSKKDSNKLRNEEIEALTNIENYIQNHLKEELTIEKLSLKAGFNTSKFKKVFKQVYGMPVFKYITALRIEKAKQLIEEYNYTIAQASYKVGYKNPQHFTVAFKKKMGYLPSELIK
ncbi:helix-turn-helix domain-containing protein [Tamlana crocina]|uniref:Helix-turn-helix transcriptional regulator n=1 Tax=Tamlana crocina TaxID=393006 RepID=A0ABX1D6H8_9FLAO|nr:AraC family transcriptional regulator [Tamlana crocina]NJX13890.1 helix-turn-helix transcriptional regulator [Tamlana crocina]